MIMFCLLLLTIVALYGSTWNIEGKPPEPNDETED